MSGYLAGAFIVATVVVARVAYRSGFNFFTFVLGWGTLLFAGLIVTGNVP